MKSSLTAAKFCTLDENEKITKVWSSNPLFVIGTYMYDKWTSNKKGELDECFAPVGSLLNMYT